MFSINKIVSIVSVILITLVAINALFIAYIGSYNNKLKFNYDDLETFYSKNIVNVNTKPYNISHYDFTQKKLYTSGPAAIRYVLFYYGIMVSEEELSSHFMNMKKEITLHNIINIFDRYSLEANRVLVDFDNLKELRSLAIVYLADSQYVVIKKIVDNYVYLFDPNPEYGEIKMKKKIFLKIWDGFVIKIRTKSIVKGET